MTAYLKEIILICTYVASIVAVFVSFKSRVNKIENSQKNIDNILFERKGGLNLVNNHVCQERRQVFVDCISEERAINKEAAQKLECMNQNLIKLLIHLKLEPIRLERKNG